MNGKGSPRKVFTKPSRKLLPPNVVRKLKLDGEWRFYPLAKTAKGFDFSRVMIAGKPVPVSGGTFYLEYRENGRLRRRSAGADPRDVKSAIVNQTSVRQLRASGMHVDDAPELYDRPKLEGKSIAAVVNTFCDAPPIGLRTRSLGKYRFELRLFETWEAGRGKTHLVQLGRQDILDFMAYLVRVESLALKTAINKAVIVLKQMRDAGARIEMKRGDWPPVTEAQPDTYTPEQLEKLFAVCRADEYTLFQTFLLTGFREQEVGSLGRPDFDPRAGSLTVTKKDDYDFDPKNYMERTNPIAPVLVDRLTKHIAKLDDDEYLLFGTAKGHARGKQSGGKRDKHMLRKLKRIAWHNGLNCGHCQGVFEKQPASCRDKPICEQWTLHKFRHTYATRLLHDGWDLVTVQKLLGHRKIESTMKYVRSLQPAHVTERMKTTALAAMFG